MLNFESYKSSINGFGDVSFLNSTNHLSSVRRQGDDVSDGDRVSVCGSECGLRGSRRAGSSTHPLQRSGISSEVRDKLTNIERLVIQCGM